MSVRNFDGTRRRATPATDCRFAPCLALRAAIGFLKMGKYSWFGSVGVGLGLVNHRPRESRAAWFEINKIELRGWVVAFELPARYNLQYKQRAPPAAAVRVVDGDPLMEGGGR